MADFGSILGNTLTGGLTMASIVTMAKWMGVFIVLAFLTYLLIRMMKYKAIIMVVEDLKEGGTRTKWDKGKLMTKDHVPKLRLLKYKTTINYPSNKFAKGKKDFVILHRDVSGDFHEMEYITNVNARDENGIEYTLEIPAIVPQNADVRHWKVIQDKLSFNIYKDKSLLSQLAPYLTIAVTGIIIVIMLYVGKKI